MRYVRSLVIAGIVHACATDVLAADRLILGKKMIVKNPTGAEDKRTVIVQGKEKPSDISSIVGDPTTSGATLDILANGTSATTQSFSLPNTGWSATSTGFKYVAPTGAVAPVKKVILKRTNQGVMQVNVLLKGNVGTQSLDILPPNTGTDGGLSLQITGGDRYCVSLGGAAGGTEMTDTNEQWKIKDATAQPGCPAPPVVSGCCTGLPSLLKVKVTSSAASTGSVTPATCESGGACPCGGGELCLGPLLANTAYIGGGGTTSSTFYLRTVPVGTEVYMKIASCSGPDPVLTAATDVEAAAGGTYCSTPAGTPSAGMRHCTSAGCYFGPPIEFTLPTLGPICGINKISSTSVSGSLDCATGSMAGTFEFMKDVYFDLYLSSSCPRCTGGSVGMCGSGTCDSGARAGMRCTPESSSLTSLDCFPSLPPAATGPFTAGGTTGSDGLTAFATSSNTNIFCGYCYTGSAWGLPCVSDAGCTPPEVCTAHSNGAFGHLAATAISQTGSAPGTSVATGAHSITLVDVGCIAASAGSGVAGIPGPSASSLVGTIEIIP